MFHPEYESNPPDSQCGGISDVFRRPGYGRQVSRGSPSTPIATGDGEFGFDFGHSEDAGSDCKVPLYNLGLGGLDSGCDVGSFGEDLKISDQMDFVGGEGLSPLGRRTPLEGRGQEETLIMEDATLAERHLGTPLRW